MRRLQAWVLVFHPLPVCGVCALATMLGLSASPDPSKLPCLALVIAAIFCSQVVVGASNDLVDLPLDRRSQPWKPLVAGAITTHEVYALIALAFVLMVWCMLWLGASVSVFIVSGTIAGLSHNFLTKGTRFDWASYTLGFTVLPLVVWSAIEKIPIAQLTLLPTGVCLLPAVIIARDLPDITHDQDAGKNGLAVRLGQRRSVFVLGLCMSVAPVVAVLAINMVGFDARVFVAGLSIYLILLCIILTRYRSAAETTLRTNFRLTMGNAIVLIASSLFAIQT
jgi:4-hydroxybenzoate polyprenyltransferase